MKPTKTKHKIYLIFAAIQGFFFLYALLLFNQSIVMKQQSIEIETNWMPSVVATNSMNAAMSSYRIAEALHIMSGDANEKDEYEQIMQRVSDDIAHWQSKYEHMITSPLEQDTYNKFVKDYGSYLIASRQMLTLSQNSQKAIASDQFRRAGALSTTISDDLLKLVNINNEGSSVASEKSDQIFKQAKMLIVVASIIIILGLALAAFITASTKSSADKLSQLLSKNTDKPVSNLVKSKIYITFLIIALAFIGFSGLFVKEMNEVNKQISEFNKKWLPSIIQAQSINTDSNSFRAKGGLHILTDVKNTLDLEQIDKERVALLDAIKTSRQQYEALINSDEERRLYTDFTQGYEEYLLYGKQVVEFSNKNEKDKATGKYKQAGVLFLDFINDLTKLSDFDQNNAIKVGHSVEATFEQIKILNIGGGFFIVALLIICSQLIQSWMLDKPIVPVALHSGTAKTSTIFTIKVKLRMAFLGMVGVFIVFALLVSDRMQSINDETAKLTNKWRPSRNIINAIQITSGDYRIIEHEHVATSDETQILEADKSLARSAKRINDLIADYEKLVASDEERVLYQNFTHHYDDYMRASEATLSLSHKNDKASAFNQLQHNRLRYEAFTIDLNKLRQFNQLGSDSVSDKEDRIFYESQSVILAAGLIIFMLAIIFMIMFDKNVAYALQRLTTLIQRLANGSIIADNDFQHRADEIGQMAQAVSVVTNTLQTLTNDSLELIEAAQTGILSVRAETKRHPGEFGRIVFGMNQLLDVLSKPLMEVAQVMQNLALGDLAGRMQGEYEGELRTLKANVNRSLDALVSLLNELSDTTKHMANGDLTHLLQGNYQGEFSVLKANINRTIAQMTEILQEITTHTANSAAAITQTSEASKYVAKEASLQMFALEEVVKTIEETASSVHQIAQKANTGSELARSTAGLASEGEAQLNKLMSLIQHVDSEYSKIEQITGEITRIADKTHLLSLNAGLEAMRAGEHGLGFGFVAQQIGKLAEEVSVSARDIGTVITSSGQSVRLGVHAMQETRTSMEQIAVAAQSSEQTVQDISAAIVQQSTAVNSLSERVNDIQSSSKATASSAEEISVTMVHLAQTIRQTATQAQRFHLTDKK
jgi:methyl-accepting chemotaxis protein